ncbi:hypothetical protein OHA21_01365 [Actinoplanes sp. NBC_00393]|uniref:hypothetical protein n=1 Tax=Actinoplanes sp. NBC_00393 TaxID=2975953 RepID=UPI002E1CB5ED
MQKQVDQEQQWLLWPVRALAVVVVLPFRLLWEGAKLIGRFLAWLWRHLVAIPVLWLSRLIGAGLTVLGRWLSAALRVLIGVPLAWLWRQALRPVLRAIWQYVLRPVFVAVVLAVTFVIERVVAPVAGFVYRWVLAPVGRALVWFLRAGWQGTSWLGVQLYRFLLRPLGIAVAWLWRYTFGALFRGIGWLWSVTVTPAARWIRDEILRPAAAAARSVLVAVGLRR